jgi:hypothetical protein
MGDISTFARRRLRLGRELDRAVADYAAAGCRCVPMDDSEEALLGDEGLAFGHHPLASHGYGLVPH